MGGSGAEYGEGGASDEEVNEVVRVQWATSYARMERWTEEVELLQEEMRRVVMFLEWKSENWSAKQDVRLTTASSSVQSGLRAYAQKQAAIRHDLAVSFSRLWRPTLVSYDLKHSWVTKYMEKHGIPLSDTNVPPLQARGISKTRVLDETGGGSSQASAIQHVQIQDSSNAAMDDNVMLLEEVPYVEDDEDEGDYLEAWGSPYRLGPDNNNNSDDDNDDSDNDDNDNDNDNDHDNDNDYSFDYYTDYDDF
jgi:hypothetical protein